MSDVIKLTEEQKDAFFEVAKKLPEKIYPQEGVQSSIERLLGGVSREGLFGELFKDTENKNVYLRIVKEILASEDFGKTVQTLITFYNDPKNERIWKKEH